MVRYGTQLSLDPGWGEIHKAGGYASTLEGLGYGCIWCPDERFGRSPYALLSIAALHTETAQLGVSVTNPYTRHPLITGAAAATLNELSAGRAVLGLGAGASTLFERHGVERPSPPLTAMCEAVQMLRPFLRGEKVDYKGAVRGAGSLYIDFEYRPVPIYIAARGPRLLRLAGEVADGVIIGSLASEQGLGYALENIAVGLERSGRSRRDIEVHQRRPRAGEEHSEAARGILNVEQQKDHRQTRGRRDKVEADRAGHGSGVQPWSTRIQGLRGRRVHVEPGDYRRVVRHRLRGHGCTQSPRDHP